MKKILVILALLTTSCIAKIDQSVAIVSSPHLITESDCVRICEHEDILYQDQLVIDNVASCEGAQELKAIYMSKHYNTCQDSVGNFTSSNDFNCFIDAENLSMLKECDMETPWGTSKVVSLTKFSADTITYCKE